MRKRNEELNQIVYTQMEKLSQIENINMELADKNKVCVTYNVYMSSSINHVLSEFTISGD